MTVLEIMNRVSTLYNDTTYDRVSQEMYLRFLDDALNQLVLVRPDAHVKVSSVQLATGTRQTVPADCLALIDIYRNKGALGTTDGAPIWQVNRKDLDYFADWHTAPTVAPTEITEYSYDPKYPDIYWVSPAVAATPNIFVEMAYSYPFTSYAAQGWATAIGQTIPCHETFKGPICSYMLYLLYSTDSSSELDKTVAESYRVDFYNALGIEIKASTAAAPVPGDTTVSGA